MQGNRGGGDPFFNFGDPFAGLGGFSGFAGQRSLASSFFGGRDPFDDPFFTRPFGGLFEPSIFRHTGNPFMDAHASGYLEHQVPRPNRSRGPIIEELNSDDEREQEDKEEEEKDNPRKHSRSSKEPYVEDPDDETEGRKSKQMQYMNDFSRVNYAHSRPQTHSFTFQSSSVSYGGVNGTHYTSSRTMRTGSDGVSIVSLSNKEADTASGQAAHRIFKGIHDKGHTVARKLNSDGRVDTMQTLHNLNEEELSGFEQVWNGNAKHLPGWSEGLNDGSGTSGQNGPASRGGWALPSTEHPQHSGRVRSNVGGSAGPSRSQHSGRMKADDGVRTGSGRGRPRSATNVNINHARRH
ncbi:glycine-rich protein [Actinidia rufa]|uniref:Glycine-rich protein n=1 Tax=Actinidia rufa TaxID=165716 RepID=A0A7J0EIC2_9ERIC|nr:glycine-rich protein [Actinidia rufa]